MRLIDPNKTVQRVERTEHGGVLFTDHFNGSVDANVKLSAIKVSLTQGAAPDKDHVAAIAELEAATKEHQLAKESGVANWLRYTTARLKAANERVRAVQ
jgi:hypothetical protein